MSGGHVRYTAKQLGFALGPFPSQVLAQREVPLLLAIEQRYPEGIVPGGVAAELAAEFGIGRLDVVRAIKRRGFREAGMLDVPLSVTIKKRWPGGVIPFGSSAALAREFGVTHREVYLATKRLGFTVVRSRK